MRPSGVVLCGAVVLAAAAPAGQRSHPPEPQPAIQRAEQSSGTRALLIAVSPVDEQVAWASGSQGTWVRTIDGGTTWMSGRVPGADSLQFRDVHAVDAHTAYLLSIGDGAQSRIYKTVDGGASWTEQFRNADPAGFYDCFDFWDAERGIAIGDAIGTEMAVLTTSDGGAHWTRVAAAALPAAAAGEGSFAASGTCVETGPGGLAWIVMSTPARSRLLRTTDFGATWRVDSLPISSHEGSGAQSVIFRDASHGMVLGGGYATVPGDLLVATTADGGATWSSRTTPALKVGAWGGSWVPGAAVPTVVAVGPNGSVYSRDEGASWVLIDTLNYWSVAFASPRAGWAVGTQGRITKLSGF
ncbi:MAG: hypothetical protein KJZ74_01840 [Gemmatimonadales bacterium]|nr:hypothetical protein [Gemmatimonadales bacterium]